MNNLTEHQILIFLLQIFLLLGLSRLGGEIFRIFKQPPITAEILVGIFLGPTIFGRLAPELQQKVFPMDPTQLHMLETMSWLGLFFLLLEAGLEIDFGSAWRQKTNALVIGVTGVLVPILFSFVFFLFVPSQYLLDQDHRIIFAFFMATVLAITAVPIVSRTLHDLNILKTDLGLLIMSAHAVNDILGWLIVSLVMVFISTGDIVFSQVLTLLFLVLGFVTFCLSIGRVWVNKAILYIKHRQLPEPSTSLTFIFILGLACGSITQLIGIHPLLGFLIAGIMAGSAKALSEKTRHVISQVVFALFVPLFFATIGLQMDFFKNFDLRLALIITTIGILGKFLGGFVGATLTRQSQVNRIPIAIAHTPGGMMEIVVGLIALRSNLISQNIFVAIVIEGVISSIVLGPWLNYSIKNRKEFSILEFFSSRFTIDRLKRTERDLVIEELCELASLESGMPPAEKLAEMVLKRENEMGTAIEEGIALPHARLPVLSRPMVVIGRSLPGVEWNSPDGKPSHFIFLILTPQHEDNLQIQILRAIVTVMADAALRKSILAATDKTQIWNLLLPHLNSYHIRLK